jgi:type II secretory pathway component PulC
MFIALQGIILHRPHQEQGMIIAPGGHKTLSGTMHVYCLRLHHVSQHDHGQCMNIVKHGEQSMFIALQGIILHRPHQEQCMIIAPGGHKNIIRNNACLLSQITSCITT